LIAQVNNLDLALDLAVDQAVGQPGTKDNTNNTKDLFLSVYAPDWNSLNQGYSSGSVVQLGIALYGVHVDLLLV
jgi:hypothetical protein